MSLNEPFQQILDEIPDTSESYTAEAQQLGEIFGREFAFVNCIAQGVTGMQTACHGLAKRAGWWNDPATGEPKDRNDGELIALMHSELSEALEGVRKNSNDSHLPHRKSVEVELPIR